MVYNIINNDVGAKYIYPLIPERIYMNRIFADNSFVNKLIHNKYVKEIRLIAKKISRDMVTGFAASSCFYILLSLFPFLLVLMELIHYLPVTADSLTEIIRDIVPTQLLPVFESFIIDIYNNSSITLLSITIITALWAAGRGFISISHGLNTIYDSKKSRSWIKQRIISTIYTVILLLIIVLSLFALVFGNLIVEILGSLLPSIALILKSILGNKLIIFPSLLAFIFMIFYKYIPNRPSTFLKEFPGALTTAAGWYLFSWIYSIYIDKSPNFSYMYGSLATLIISLIWIYCCMIIFFIGAELNCYLSNRQLFRDRKTEE